MYSQIKPYINGKTLKVGSGIGIGIGIGIGNISGYFVKEGKEIDLSDIR